MTDREPTPRERARAETIEQIKQIARTHLAADGPDLSLRAVARDLGVVSSAVYRYFASRDDLLTALILDGYASLADAVESAEGAVPRRDLLGRFRAQAHATRNWAYEHQHEYGLLYGSPVPGYAAPPDTTLQAQRPVLVSAGIIADAAERGLLEVPAERLPRQVRADLQTLAGLAGLDTVPVPVIARAMTVWALLHGTISLEIFGRFEGLVTDLDAYFDTQVKVMARHVGLVR